MRGHVALRAEFLARPHDAGAEDGFPKAVRDHACGERVGFIHEPACEREAVHRRVLRQRMKCGGHALGHLVSEHLKIAAQLDLCLAPLRGREFAQHGHSHLRDAVNLLSQSHELFAFGLQFRRDLARVVFVQPPALRGRAILFYDREDAEHVHRRARVRRDARIGCRGNAEAPERRLLGFRFMLDGDDDARSGGRIHGLRREQRERVRLRRRAADAPARRLLTGFRRVGEHALLVKVRLREIRDCGAECDLAAVIQGERDGLRRRVIVGALPHGPPLRVERDHAEAFQPLGRLGAVPHGDALQREVCFQVHLPPAIIALRGVRHGALRVFAVRVPINRPLRLGVRKRARLRGHTAERDVFSAAENLDLRELEDFVFTRKLDADKPRNRSLRRCGRNDRSAHSRDDEIPAAVSRALAGQHVRWERFDPERGDFLRCA